MALFPQQFIDDLRLHANIVQVIQEYVPLKRAGKTYKGLCPFHGEKTPSFHVDPERGFFHCFGCNASGDAIKFVQETEGLDFIEAVRRLAEQMGIDVIETTNDAERRQISEAKRRQQELFDVNAHAAAFFE